MEARVKTHTRLLRWQSHPNFLYSSPLTHPHVSLLSRDPRPATFCSSCRAAFLSRARRSDSCTAWARICPA